MSTKDYANVPFSDIQPSDRPSDAKLALSEGYCVQCGHAPCADCQSTPFTCCQSGYCHTCGKSLGGRPCVCQVDRRSQYDTCCTSVKRNICLTIAGVILFISLVAFPCSLMFTIATLAHDPPIIARFQPSPLHAAEEELSLFTFGSVRLATFFGVIMAIAGLCAGSCRATDFWSYDCYSRF